MQVFRSQITSDSFRNCTSRMERFALHPHMPLPHQVQYDSSWQNTPRTSQESNDYRTATFFSSLGINNYPLNLRKQQGRYTFYKNEQYIPFDQEHVKCVWETSAAGGLSAAVNVNGWGHVPCLETQALPPGQREKENDTPHLVWAACCYEHMQMWGREHGSSALQNFQHWENCAAQDWVGTVKPFAKADGRQTKRAVTSSCYRKSIHWLEPHEVLQKSLFEHISRHTLFLMSQNYQRMIHFPDTEISCA